VDACANPDGSNAQVAKFYSSQKSFLKANVEGENVWLNAPFRRAGTFLQHYLKNKERAPTQTCGVIVLPQWDNKPWWRLTQGFRLLRTYPAGTNLFTAPPKQPGGPRVSMGPTKWPMCVFWDPPMIQGFVKAPSVELDNKEEITAGELCGLRTTTTQLIKFNGRIQGRSVRILLDCGAAENYINTTLAQELQLPTIYQPGKMVQLAGPVTQDASTLIPSLPFRIGQYKDRLPFTVTKLVDYDMILGKPWLTYRNPKIDWINNTVSFQRRGTTYTLQPPVEDQSPQVALLSALQLKREIKKGATAVTCHAGSSKRSFALHCTGDLSLARVWRRTTVTA
jgi:hypothetical protein